MNKTLGSAFALKTLIATLTAIALLSLWNIPAYASMNRQTGTFTLKIINNSPTSRICFAYVFDEVNEQSTFGIEVLKGKELAFLDKISVPIPDVIFNVALFDCDQNLILLHKHLTPAGNVQTILESSSTIDPGEVTSLLSLGALLKDQYRFDKSNLVFLQAFNYLQELPDSEHKFIELAFALTYLGENCSDIGEFSKSEEFLLKAQDMYENKLMDPYSSAIVTSNIAEMYRRYGKFDQSFQYYKMAKHQYETNPDLSEGLPRIINSFGLLYEAVGDSESALDYFIEAQKIAKLPVDKMTVLNSLGVHFASMETEESIKKGISYYEQALNFAQSAGDPIKEARTYNNLGKAYFRIGDLKKAKESYDLGLNIFEGKNYTDALAESALYSNIGEIFLYEENYKESIRFFEQSLNIISKTDDQVSNAIILSNIAYAKHIQYVKNKEGSVEEALKYYNQALDILDNVRAVAGDELKRADFISQYSDIYARAVLLYHIQGQDPEAFTVSERGRARSFLDTLATGYLQLMDKTAEELIEQEGVTYKKILSLKFQLASALEAGNPDPIYIKSLESNIKKAEVERDLILERIKKRNDNLLELIPDRKSVLDLKTVQSLIDDKTTLISYFIVGEKDLGFQGALAFIITKSGFKVVELPDATPENLLGATPSRQKLLSDLSDPYPQYFQDLYAWIVAPLLSEIKTPMVGVIPHQRLHYVPFAALTDGKSYFGDRHMLFILSSASSLQYINENTAEKSGQGALVFGNPTSDHPGLSPLIHASDEAKSVARLLKVDAFTDENASEARFWSDSYGVAIIHLAVHAIYIPENPLSSTLYLSPGEGNIPNTDIPNNGRLEVNKVYSLNLKGTKLVVLSACESALRQPASNRIIVISKGDEIVGLPQAFHFAGVPSVISTLWRVDDESTQILMESFYRKLSQGMGYAQALRAAQDEVRSNKKWASPYYWAGFTLSGDPGIIKQDNCLALIISMVVFGIILFAIIIFSRRK